MNNREDLIEDKVFLGLYLYIERYILVSSQIIKQEV